MPPKQLFKLHEGGARFIQMLNCKLSRSRNLAILLVFSALVWLSCGGGNGGGGNNNGGNGGGQSSAPTLTATVTTQGNFSSGQQNATYDITVKNTGNAPTNGTVTIVDPPTGFTVTGVSGTNWTCTLATATCTRSDSLAAGQSFPAIVVTGTVTAANGTPVSIPLNISGGGISAPVNSTPTVTVAAPALTLNATHTGNFNLGQQAAAYSLTVKNGSSAGATNAKVTVTETVPSGENLISMSGTGWTCPGAGGANTCDRSDTLASGDSYPAVSVTVNVAADATSPQVNQASVSGGGMSQAASGSDPTTINMPDLAIAETHIGTFSDAGNGTFNIAVTNVASGATAGPTAGLITVADTLPADFTFVSAGATGWNCAAAAQTVTCTNATPLNPGAAASTIALTVSVSATASGTISNTAAVSAFGDGNSGNNSSSDSVSFAPDLAVTAAHSGNFGAGTNGAFTLSVSNIGTGPTTGSITVSDTLDSQLSFVSGNASGWTCSAALQLVTCTNPGPLARGISAASIPLVVAVNGSASGSIANIASVSTNGDTNAGNDSSSDEVTIVGLPPSVAINVPGAAAAGVIYAGGNSITVGISVANDETGDTLTPALSLGGFSCSVCGTLGAIVAGTPGNYALSYTPPASLTAPITVTLTVNSSLANSFAATASFNVYPAGTRVVKITGIAGGPGVKNLSARVFNDPGTPGPGLSLQLLGGGHACPPNGSAGTLCGTLEVTSTVSAVTNTSMGTTGVPFSMVAFTYTPPATLPNSPYDRPMILAVSNGDPTKTASVNFAVFPNAVFGGIIGAGARLNVALTGGSPLFLNAGLAGDTGVNKTVSWTLTANGAECQPDCGTLGTPTYTRNGNAVNVTVPYTPPATVPDAPADQPTLTVTSVDVINGAQQKDAVEFRIKDGSCGTGNNGALNGQYAFLLEGGSSAQGYGAFVGSFTADGSGNITGGSVDINRTVAPATGLSVVPAGSSYSIGPDNRGCVTLASSTGTVALFRFALGAMDGSKHATKGRIIRFDDYTGGAQRLQGVLMKQDATTFADSALNGNYVFGFQGVEGSGARVAVVGLYHADGAGNLSNFDVDSIDSKGNINSNDTTASGTYSIDQSTGRGTVAIANGPNIVFYVVSSSEFLSMSADPFGPATPILSGEHHKQTAANFAQTSLDNNAYVFYQSALDPANGGNASTVGRVQFGTNGSFSGQEDVNDNGELSSDTFSDTFTIAPNGRMTTSNGDLVGYAIGTDSAVILANDNSVPFGYVEQQTGAPFSNASLSGGVFFGSAAPTIGAEFDSGTAFFDGAGAARVSVDGASPTSLSSESANLSYQVTSTSTGRFTVAEQNTDVLAGYVLSGAKIVFIPLDTDPSAPAVFIGEQ